jgi:hypothetical protein
MTMRLPAAPGAALRYPLCAALYALLAIAPASAQYTEPVLGRLFTAPDERMRLDRERSRAPLAGATTIEPVPQAKAPLVAEPSAPPPTPARFTGMVRRSDGRATVWIDDEPRETTLGRYRAGSAIPVDTPGGRVLVKPGENIDPNNAAIRDAR